MPDAATTLLALNRAFYARFGAAFAEKRGRLQPGVARLLPRIPPAARVLDLGCGHGAVLRALRGQGFHGRYIGLDFSPALLTLAQPAAREAPTEADFRFLPRDLTAAGWEEGLPAPFDFVLAFAVLHHIPGAARRQRLLRQIRALLPAGGRFFHSHWQFLNSPRLRQRIQPWAAAGLSAADVEAGDYLLDWRHQGYGLRYVHHFSPAELRRLAAATGFEVRETFFSDGEGGRLGLYQVWEAVDA